MAELSTAQRLMAYYTELIAAGFTYHLVERWIDAAAPRNIADVTLDADSTNPETGSRIIGNLLAGEGTLFGKRVELSWPNGLPDNLGNNEALEELGRAMVKSADA